jgi:hypothetical protein
LDGGAYADQEAVYLSRQAHSLVTGATSTAAVVLTWLPAGRAENEKTQRPCHLGRFTTYRPDVMDETSPNEKREGSDAAEPLRRVVLLNPPMAT